MTREEKNEYNKKYREKNRDSLRAQARENYRKNREKILQREREKYNKNKTSITQRRRNQYHERKRKIYNKGYKDGLLQAFVFGAGVVICIAALWFSSNSLLNNKLEDSERRAEFWLEQYKNKGVK